jgi:hypothetical protein
MIWILCFHRWQRTFHFFFFIVIENFRGEGKSLMLQTHDTTFSENIIDFYKILEESEQFLILFKKKMENLRRFFSIFEVRGGNFFLTWCDSNMITFFYCKADHLSCLNKKNCLVNSKVKKNFMCFYVICMNKHVGITLSVFLLVLYTGAGGTDHPPFSNFLFANLFSIKFLYYFISFSLF